MFGTPFAAQRGGLGDTPQRTHEQAEAQQPIERDGQRLKCGAFHYWFNPAHLKLSYNHITMMMVVALILMFRSISTCCPFSVCVCVCVCVCYGAGVMQGLHPYWLANAWINSSSSTNI